MDYYYKDYLGYLVVDYYKDQGYLDYIDYKGYMDIGQDWNLLDFDFDYEYQYWYWYLYLYYS